MDRQLLLQMTWHLCDKSIPARPCRIRRQQQRECRSIVRHRQQLSAHGDQQFNHMRSFRIDDNRNRIPRHDAACKFRQSQRSFTLSVRTDAVSLPLWRVIDSGCISISAFLAFAAFFFALLIGLIAGILGCIEQLLEKAGDLATFCR